MARPPGKAHPGEEGLFRKRGWAGALGWPIGPGTRLGLLGNPGAALSAFQQASLLFPLLCSIHGPAPGPGWRVGGQAGHPLPQAWCPEVPTPASAHVKGPRAWAAELR